MLEILQAGPLTLVQDLGRPGLRHLGLGAGGAFDAPALQRANALVGNPPDAAALEFPAGPLRLRCASRDLWLALAGAEFAARIGRQAQPPGLRWRLPAGEELRLDGPISGQHGVLAIDGDGCFQMTAQELATSTTEGIPFVTAIVGAMSQPPPAALSFALLLLAAATQPRAAKLVHDSIPGPITQTRVRFTVALPDDYAADKGPYPVVYHLHGIGGNEQGNQTQKYIKAYFLLPGSILNSEIHRISSFAGLHVQTTKMTAAGKRLGFTVQAHWLGIVMMHQGMQMDYTVLK